MLAGVPIGLAYIWYGIVWPLLSDQTNDFREVYMAGAGALAAGKDPYQCTTGICAGHLQGYLGAWGSAECEPNLDGVGTVDAIDIGILLGAWGDC